MKKIEIFLSFAKVTGAQQGLRSGRAFGLQASQAILHSCSTLVSGVLIGMSNALQSGSAGAAPSRAKKA